MCVFVSPLFLVEQKILACQLSSVLILFFKFSTLKMLFYCLLACIVSNKNRCYCYYCSSLRNVSFLLWLHIIISKRVFASELLLLLSFFIYIQPTRPTKFPGGSSLSSLHIRAVSWSLSPDLGSYRHFYSISIYTEPIICQLCRT